MFMWQRIVSVILALSCCFSRVPFAAIVPACFLLGLDEKDLEMLLLISSHAIGEGQKEREG
jgi:hypothetical protein